MQVDRVARPKPKDEWISTRRLRKTVAFLGLDVIRDAWFERLGIDGSPNWRVNKAFMLGQADLAERRGDLQEGERLRGTVEDIEERFGLVAQENTNGQKLNDQPQELKETARIS